MPENEVQIDFEPKSSLIPIEKGLVASINNLLKELLNKTQVKGIIVPNKLENGDSFIPALITTAKRLDTANAIAPFMPLNASKAVQDYSRLTISPQIVAVVLKPCESRALVELVKLKQANIENLIIIGVDCPGTYPINISNISSTSKVGVKNRKNETYDTESLIGCFNSLKDNHEQRSACEVCEYFSPIYSDLTIGLFGQDLKKNFLLNINSPKGFEIVEPLKLKFDEKAVKEQQNRLDAINKLRTNRKKNIQHLISETEARIKGLDNFLNELSCCINCHDCMTVCPICYCKECFFESPTFDLESEKYFQLAQYKGALRLPSNMFLFHVTRFNHMVLSCVACGMCEQGCPANIPLLSIYKTVGLNAQKLFDYEPGRNLEEEIPVLTFEEDELEPR